MSDTVTMGEKSVYINNANGPVRINIGTDEKPAYKQIFSDISEDLRGWRHTLSDGTSIPRKQTDDLFNWIMSDIQKSCDRVALLVGGAGSGKSVVMRELLCKLDKDETILSLGLKSDQIDFSSTEEFAERQHLSKRLEDVFRGESANYSRLVLIIDQIDALSLTLSSNRAPLRSLLRLVDVARTIPNIRIVLSCRQYDLEYDPILEEYRFGHRVEMGLLDQATVTQILHDNQYNNISERSALFNTLCTPLYLYLFLKLSDNHTAINLNLNSSGLYDLLWKRTLNEISRDQISREKILTLLDSVSGQMYANQNLSLARVCINSSLEQELNYLLSKEFLIQVSKNKVQFFHQSLFDYVYARRFVEKGGDLLGQLKSEHQGLFVRARVKSILSFLRDSNLEKYLTTIQAILYDKDEKGKDLYRYHLKMLVLSMVGFTSNLDPKEVSFARNIISRNREYLNELVRGLRTADWFRAIQTVIPHDGLWKAMPKEDVALMLGICSSMVYTHQKLILEYLDKNLYKDLDPELRKQVIRIVSNIKPEAENQGIAHRLFHALIKYDTDRTLANLLRNMVVEDPDFVIREAKKLTEVYIDEAVGSKAISFDLRIDHELAQVYESLDKHYPDKAYKMFVEVATEICEKTQYEPLKELDGLIRNRAYLTFKPIVNPSFSGYDFADNLLSYLIISSERRVKEEIPGAVSDVRKLNKSTYDTLRVVAACTFIACPSCFHAEIIKVFTDVSLLSNCSGLLRYYYRKLLSQEFMKFSLCEKRKVIDAIMQTKHGIESGYHIEDHQKYNIAISYIGESKYEYLTEIPDEELKTNFNDIYKQKMQFFRKFGKRENTMPFRTMMRSGWSSIGEDKASKMTEEQWLKSMRKYTKNNYPDFDHPTMMGQMILLESLAGKEPTKYEKIIRRAIADKEIPSEYPLYGLRGLRAAKYGIDICVELYEVLIDQLDLSNINNNDTSFLMGLIRDSEYYIENMALTKKMIDFLSIVAKNAAERDNANDEKETAPYQSGINEIRGSACEHLVQCYRYPNHKEIVFSTLESIAGEASIRTRSAILLQMALLNHLDKHRNLSLFLLLMHDRRPNLMSMPLQDLNPLVYFINYGFDKLYDYFKSAVQIPACHEVTIPLLWLADYRGVNGASELLSEMFDASPEAKNGLLMFFVRNRSDKINEAHIYPWVMRGMEVFDEKILSTVDGVFDDIVPQWSPKNQIDAAARYIASGWFKPKSRDFLKYLGALAITDPRRCLIWLEKGLSANEDLKTDFFSISRIIEILIQAYNGLSDFSTKQEDSEFAMNLLDEMLRKPDHSMSLENYLFTLDNA